MDRLNFGYKRERSWSTRGDSPNGDFFAALIGGARFAVATRRLLTTAVDRSSFFIALVVVDVLAGLADAISGPYLVLFLVDQAHLSPLSLSVVLTARALAGIAFAAGFGGWVDRKPSAAPLLIALAGSAVGYASLGFTRDFALLIVIAAGPVAVSAAAFSQSIALVRRSFEHASFQTANRAVGVLRASWSLAWAMGPAIGAVIVAAAGFRGVFFMSAAISAAALATLAVVQAKPVSIDADHRIRSGPPNGGPAIALAFTAIALFHTAMFLGSIPLAIVMTTSLGGAKSDVGLAYSLCAALEIVVMGVLIWRPLKRAERPAIVIGFAVFVAYFVALALARSVGGVLWAQILRAISIALVTYLGISFLHSFMPHRAGAAAALFSNAGQLGSVFAALSAGLLAQAFGYSSIFVACAILSALGLVLVCLTPAATE
jgi:MFS transporter, SET family, sugar efflux transporter